MKVFVFTLRNLIWGTAAFCLVLVIGLFLLLNDPLDVSSPYQLQNDSIQTSTQPAANPFESAVKPSLALDVKVDGSTAEVKMITENFQFVKEGEADPSKAVHGKGHAHLYLNGQLFGKIYEPEFLLKKLPKGTHDIRIELNYSNHMPYQVDAVKTITVK